MKPDRETSGAEDFASTAAAQAYGIPASLSELPSACALAPP